MLDVVGTALGVLLLAQAGDCAIAIDVSRDGAVLMRPACPAGRERTRETIAGILDKADSNRVRLSFGRIERYAWLSELLQQRAASAGDWKPGIGKDNAYVRAKLAGMPEFIGLFGTWRVTGVSVEKVLVTPRTRLPYDALLWVTLER